jgi:hypothetical protein
MFVRWIQFCAMGTIIRIHSNTCCDHRPWTWGTPAENAIRTVLKLRYSLIPTLVAAGRKATEDGTPLVRRLDLEWPMLADKVGVRMRDERSCARASEFMYYILRPIPAFCRVRPVLISICWAMTSL